MLLSRVLSGAGRVLIAAGALILLFVAYQLWGTGVRTSVAQTSLREQFEQRLAETGTTGSSGSTAPKASQPANGDPTATTPGSPASADGWAPKPGDAIGSVVIPTIGADFAMVEGVDLKYLAEGPGHFPGTPLPGQPGNAALAGHRTTYLAPFNRIDELVPGDRITVTTVQGTFTYEVTPAPGTDPSAGVGHQIIEPTQIEILDQAPGENTLTLMACHPKYDLKQRIVVRAKLISNPAPHTEPSAESVAASHRPSENSMLAGSGTGTVELVGGDSSARTAAIVYSLLAGLVWFVAWFIARRWPSWRQWQRFAVFGAGLVVFALPLFLAFENINRLLPAGY